MADEEEEEVQTRKTKRRRPMREMPGGNGMDLGAGIKLMLPGAKATENLQNGDYDAAIRALQEMRQRANETVSIYEVIETYPLEGAYALLRALQRIYGWARPIPTPGFFGDEPPTMVSLEIGLADDGTPEVVQVPWGRMKVPNITGYLEPGMAQKNGRPVFVLQGEVRQRNMGSVRKIAETIREIVTTESIYRGRAIRVKFGAKNLFDDQPHFLDVRAAKREELIFSDDLMAQVATNIFTPIEHTDACRAAGVPLKRGILLEGPYGTGKTLVAFVTAATCVANHWTFIYLEDVKDLAKAIQFAVPYGTCVIFAEDVDKAVEGDARTDKVNAILNTIDGMDTKSHELMVVLTTNHLENINQAMLRPGRLDAVISVRPPDAAAVIKLIKLYSRNQLVPTEDLTKVGGMLAGEIPAVIREVVERAKLGAINRGSATAAGRLVLTATDLEIAAAGMLNHLELLRTKPVEDTSLSTAVARLGSALALPAPPMPTKMSINGSVYSVKVVETTADKKAA